MTPALERVREHTGFPFGIRATAQQFQGHDGYVPRGITDMEGPGEQGGVTHFFVVDTTAMQKCAENTNVVLENTVRRAVIDYGASHATQSYHHFVRDGKYHQKDLPVLYLFPVGHYVRDIYEMGLAHFRGQRTFPEACTRERMPCHAGGIIAVTNSEYAKIDQQARTHARSRNNDLCVDSETARAYFEQKNRDSILFFYDAMYNLQRALGTAVKEKNSCRKPSRARVGTALSDQQAFESQFRSYYLLNFIYNEYKLAVYGGCADKILEKLSLLV